MFKVLPAVGRLVHRQPPPPLRQQLWARGHHVRALLLVLVVAGLSFFFCGLARDLERVLAWAVVHGRRALWASVEVLVRDLCGMVVNLREKRIGTAGCLRGDGQGTLGTSNRRLG